MDEETRVLSGPCENTVRKSLSTSQKTGPHKNGDRQALCCQTSKLVSGTWLQQPTMDKDVPKTELEIFAAGFVMWREENKVEKIPEISCTIEVI